MKTNYFFLLFLIFGLSFSACSDDDSSDDNPNSPSSNVVIVDYNIFEPAIWDADSVYLVKSFIKVDAALTIQPGTIIKFYSQAGIEVWDNGVINASGNSNSSIVFTSIKHDIGGDHNSDMAQTMPNAGDWSYIDLGNQNGSTFKYCAFMYAGSTDYYGVLQLGTNSSTVENCVFTENKSYVGADEFYGALSADAASKETIIKNNVFYNNTVPLSIDAHINIDNSNEFTNPNNKEETNTYNGIFVHGQDIISSSPKWEETEVAYVLLYDGFEVWDNYTLTLGNNVTLKFFTNAWLNLQNPTVLINGQGAGVYFTSFKDDSKKGDTNGDGDATNPPPATEWLGVYNGTSFYTWSNILYSKNDF